jgi:uncharacterized delta-60 repeat protein
VTNNSRNLDTSESGEGVQVASSRLIAKRQGHRRKAIKEVSVQKFSRRFALNSKLSNVALVLTCLVLAPANVAFAQAGQLDPTFANNGIFSSSFNQSVAFATVVALQSGGKILVGGEIGNLGAVVRLNTNGTVDTTFGSAGVFSIRFRDVDNFTVGLGIQSSGKIVVSGTGLPQGGQIVRLNSNGTMDTTFGNGGSVTLSQTPSVMLLQSDDKILIGGAVPGSGVRELQRFDADGQVDSSFGAGGSAPLLGVGTMRLQPDGRILMASGDGFGPGGTLARYTSSGSLDTSFGMSGRVASLAVPAVALQTNGEVVTGGSVTSSLSLQGNPSGFGLVRFIFNGAIDFLFGQRGLATTAFAGAPQTGVSALALQPNGDIVAAGIAASSSSQAFALARYGRGGQLDPSFGSGGTVTTSFGNVTAGLGAMALQSDGKIVVVGNVNQGSLIVARYLGQ